MKLKLDENVDIRVATWLRIAGHDVATVPGQGLISLPDEELIDVCRSEGRCLVTCDRGYGNRLKYNPPDYAGIVIIRLPAHHTFEDWREVLETLILGLEQADVEGKLWIVRGKRIQYQPVEPEDTD